MCALHGGSGEGESLCHYPWVWCAVLMCAYCYANYLCEQGAICLCVPASDDVVGWVVDNWVQLCELVVILCIASCVSQPCASVLVQFGRTQLRQLLLGCW